MPHIVLKMLEGRSEEAKSEVAAALAEVLHAKLGLKEGSVSVAIHEFAPKSWKDSVYDPEIMAEPEKLVIKPGYSL